MIYKNKIVKGDSIIVITGDEKGKKGEVIKIFPKTQQVLVKDVNLLKCYDKKKDNNNSSILFKEGPIHISNVAFWDIKTNSIGKITFKINKDGTKTRVIKSKK